MIVIAILVIGVSLIYVVEPSLTMKMFMYDFKMVIGKKNPLQIALSIF